MKRLLFFCFLGICCIFITILVIWYNTLAAWPINSKIKPTFTGSLPSSNKKILGVISKSGKNFAPTYHEAVCTEFVINVIDKITPLTKEEKNSVRIITNSNLEIQIESEAPQIKGIQSALLINNKGIAISNLEEVMPGDFVQFWNVFLGRAYGHCGIVLEVEPNKTLTLYSSHPFTRGFGVQKYLWPEKAFFARLN